MFRFMPLTEIMWGNTYFCEELYLYSYLCHEQNSRKATFISIKSCICVCIHTHRDQAQLIVFFLCILSLLVSELIFHFSVSSGPVPEPCQRAYQELHHIPRGEFKHTFLFKSIQTPMDVFIEHKNLPHTK